MPIYRHKPSALCSKISTAINFSFDFMAILLKISITIFPGWLYSHHASIHKVAFLSSFRTIKNRKNPFYNFFSYFLTLLCIWFQHFCFSSFLIYCLASFSSKTYAKSLYHLTSSLLFLFLFSNSHPKTSCKTPSRESSSSFFFLINLLWYYCYYN